VLLSVVVEFPKNEKVREKKEKEIKVHSEAFPREK
jgi:hypothetical protein